MISKMPSKSVRRFILFLIFLGALTALSLLIVGFSTDYWTIIRPVRLLNNSTQQAAAQISTFKLNGIINFGLFKGYQILDGGIVSSESNIDVVGQINSNPPLWSIGLWVCVLVFGVLAMAWTLVVAGFALLNISRKPVETISGILGLYLWNALGMLFTVLSIIFYVALFYKDIQHNVLSAQNRANLWTSENRAVFSWSFWLFLSSLLPFAFNMLFVFLAGARVRCCCVSSGPEKNAIDGVLMY